MRVLVAGHSYIARLKRAIDEGKLPHDWDREQSRRVRFWGKPGGLVSCMYSRELLDLIRRHKIDRLVIFCGGNDIGEHAVSGEVLANRILDVACHYRKYVSQVVVCNLVRRKGPRTTASFSKEDYNRILDRTNECLDQWTRPGGVRYQKGVRYYVIKRLLYPDLKSGDIWLPDGIHLIFPRGMMRFSYGIRMASSPDLRFL